MSYGKSQAWTLEVTVNYLEVADIDTLTTGAGVYTANAFTDGLTLDGTFSAWRDAMRRCCLAADARGVPRRACVQSR